MRRLVALLTICSILSSCFVFRRVDVQPVDALEGTRVTSPVKAHLKDGSTIVYPRGLTVAGGFLQGAGDRYDVTLTKTGVADNVPLDLVIGMESFRTRVNVAKTAIVSTLATIGITYAAAGLAFVIFGSCPTVYSGEGVEEAELFSSSVAPLFEGRDLDRLHAKADAAGAVRLEIRNEAMETHYINHLQLLEVRHAIDETALPDTQGRPVVVGGITTPATIVDRAGRDLRATLAVADDKAYRTEQSAASLRCGCGFRISPITGGSTASASPPRSGRPIRNWCRSRKSPIPEEKSRWKPLRGAARRTTSTF